ncbi:glycerophosphodiester phosphodiesterase [Rhodococcus sp. BP-332]|uniref:glycerophosphodiester phosphodiesterase family protein n=1 Tax=Rhodococcus sp. BP-332 TaxID=2739447 RepID=UPI0035ABF84E|nr:glycerophosphodiester phosphodiesterase [Rhodococcus sp. BP-332]
MAMRRVLLTVSMCVALAACSAQDAETAKPLDGFDLQAHRGGLGLVTESTLASFTNALELGVTTLEMDTQITEDGIAVVTHDRKVSDAKCRDTRPITDNDPVFPYVGKYVNTLTLAQVRTLNCGVTQLDGYPEQRVATDAGIPTLDEVLALVNSYDSTVQLNIETKVEAAAPTETASREQFADVVLASVGAAGLLDRTTIQSFDWGALLAVQKVDPSVRLVALTEHDFLEVGESGASPWLGGLDIDEFDGDPVAAVQSFGAHALSPVQGNPQKGAVGDADFELYVTPELVASAHAAGIRVVPWTVDDPATMAVLMDMGVDGIITDYPDRLREAMGERGMALPESATVR